MIDAPTGGDVAMPDPRLRPAAWRVQAEPCLRRRLAAMAMLDVALALFYFTWLLSPARVGTAPLFALLVAAELFNLAQGAGFWSTVLRVRAYQARPWRGRPPEVDVLIPVYGESVEIVEPTGAETMVELKLGERTIVGRFDPDEAPRVGERVAVSFDMAKACLFDPKSERLIG